MNLVVHLSRLLTPFRWVGAETVTLFVGTERLPLVVLKDKLCEASTFFNSAFKGGYKETATSSMELPEGDERALNLLMGWLYGQFSLHNLPVGDLDLLFLCADRMDLPRLRKEYVDVVFDWMTKQENKRYASFGSREKVREHITEMYAHTLSGSSYRRLLADHIIFKVRLSADTLEWLRSQPDFATDLFVGMIDKDHGKQNPFKHGAARDFYDAGIIKWVSGFASSTS